MHPGCHKLAGEDLEDVAARLGTEHTRVGLGVERDCVFELPLTPKESDHLLIPFAAGSLGFWKMVVGSLCPVLRAEEHGVGVGHEETVGQLDDVPASSVALDCFDEGADAADGASLARLVAEPPALARVGRLEVLKVVGVVGQ